MDSKQFSARFKSARILSGMTLDALSQGLGERKVSKQSLHKYEKGEVIPDPQMMEALCTVLGVVPEFFTREIVVELKAPEFRKLKNVPAKEEDRIIEFTRDHLSRYLELEEIVGIRTEFNNPLKNFQKINSPEDIDEAVRILREEWALGDDPIFNVVELLEDHHIKVIKLEVEDGFDGLQTWVNEKIPVIAYNNSVLKKHDRIRFTVMHELAHLLLEKALEHLPHGKKETHCHQFAAAMLFSKNAAIMEVGVKRHNLLIQELGNLKMQYGISMQAIMFRLKDLKIITDRYFKQFYFYFVQNGWRIDEPYTYEGVEKSNRFDQLLFRALAEELITYEQAASLKNMRVSKFKEDYKVL